MSGIFLGGGLENEESVHPDIVRFFGKRRFGNLPRESEACDDRGRGTTGEEPIDKTATVAEARTAAVKQETREQEQIDFGS